MNIAVLSLIHLGLFGASIGTVLADDVEGCPRIIKRNEWNAQPPAGQLDNMTTPVANAIILHTASQACTTQSECIFRTRLIQTLHIEAYGWDDIGYSFLIGGDGNVYQGRGWDKVGAFAFGWNSKSVGIGFIGTFNDVEPSEEMMSTARRLLDCGKARGFLTEKFRLFGHRQVSQTLSPGDKLYALIQQWPEWSANPKGDETS